MASDRHATGPDVQARPARPLRLDIDWVAVEQDYRAGRLSLRDLAGKHGCSHSAIANRADRLHWARVQTAPAAAPAEARQHHPMQGGSGS